MTFSNKTLYSKMANNKSNNWINIVSILGMWPLSRDGGRATAPPLLTPVMNARNHAVRLAMPINHT